MNQILTTYFGFPHQAVLAQFSTMSSIGPNISSMRLWEANEDGNLLFFSALDTKKCAEISLDPRVALCVFGNLGQLTALGKARIISASEDPNILRPYWESLPQETRKIYIRNGDSSFMPDNFVALNVDIFQYEWLELGVHYLEIKRMLLIKLPANGSHNQSQSQVNRESTSPSSL